MNEGLNHTARAVESLSIREHLAQSFRALLIKHRRILIIIFHAFLVIGSNYLAYLVLFEDAVPSHFIDLFWQILPWLLVIRLVSFAPFHLYQGMWRYTGVADLASIAAAATISTILVLCGYHLVSASDA
jgi:FlaA1/EpsC-like NDP-sugar epimerase